jgi:hypothetical protein
MFVGVPRRHEDGQSVLPAKCVLDLVGERESSHFSVTLSLSKCEPEGWNNKSIKRNKMENKNDIVIVGAVRTPFSRFDSPMAAIPSIDLGVMVIREVVQRTGIQESIIRTCFERTVKLVGITSLKKKRCKT